MIKQKWKFPRKAEGEGM